METKKMYKLLGADGNIYESETPGQFGGNGKLTYITAPKPHRHGVLAAP